MVFPAGKASSPHNTTVRIFFFLVPRWPGWLWVRVRVRAGSVVVLEGLASSAACVVPAAEMVSEPLRTKGQKKVHVFLPCAEEFLPPGQGW